MASLVRCMTNPARGAVPKPPATSPSGAARCASPRPATITQNQSTAAATHERISSAVECGGTGSTSTGAPSHSATRGSVSPVQMCSSRHPIVATGDGTVGSAGWSGGYGLMVAIAHGDGVQSRYAHMSRLAVAPGQKVRQGDVIGYVGSTGRSTGPHLHYEVRVGGVAVDPLR